MSFDPLSPEKARIFADDFLPTREEIGRVFNGEKSGLFFVRGHPEAEQYEVLNLEFVKGLAAYLVERTKVIKGDQNPATILEVGAGTGKLSYFLGQAIGRTANNLTVIATDSGDYDITPLHPVEQLDAKTSLARYNPDIVIASWMPNGVDWTQEMRDTPSVMEYVLIGEPSGGCCGDDWLTWGSGMQRIFDLEEEIEESTGQKKKELEFVLHELENAQAPSERDGFVMHYLNDLSALQTVVEGLNSCTVSFRRER